MNCKELDDGQLLTVDKVAEWLRLEHGGSRRTQVKAASTSRCWSSSWRLLAGLEPAGEAEAVRLLGAARR